MNEKGWSTEAHLAAVLEWAKGNRGSKQGNPYGIPEIKAALQHMARIRGVEDYLDINTAKIAVPLVISGKE